MRKNALFLLKNLSSLGAPAPDLLPPAAVGALPPDSQHLAVEGSGPNPLLPLTK